MILGMSTATYTLLHVVISLIGIGSGLVVIYGLLVAKPLNGITAIFLITTVLTSVTGFGFPFEHLLPSHKVGIISLVLLAIAIIGKYTFHLAGAWRWIYVVTAMMALYLNVFVLDYPVFRKGARFEGTGSETKRTAFCGHAIGRTRNVYCADHFCGKKVPDRGGSRSLIHHYVAINVLTPKEKCPLYLALLMPIHRLFRR